MAYLSWDILIVKMKQDIFFLCTKSIFVPLSLSLGASRDPQLGNLGHRPG